MTNLELSRKVSEARVALRKKSVCRVAFHDRRVGKALLAKFAQAGSERAVKNMPTRKQVGMLEVHRRAVA